MSSEDRSSSQNLNRASMPNVWALNFSLKFNFLKHRHLQIKKRSVASSKSFLNFAAQSLFAIVFAWLSANFFAMTGSVPDVTSGSALKWNADWMLQSTDLSANILLAASVFSGQFFWFLVVWRILHWKVLRFSYLTLLPLFGFGLSVYFLLARYSDLGIVYENLYISTPKEFVVFLIPFSIIFFVGVESIRVSRRKKSS
jgi:hypothetical protein